MKVLQVIPYFAPNWHAGGPLRVCYELSKQLITRGHKVAIYTTDATDAKTRTETIAGIEVRRFRNLSNPFVYNHNILPSLGMVSAIKNELGTFDVVHVHEYRTVHNSLVHHYAKKYGIPYILQAHGGLPNILQAHGGLKTDPGKVILKKIFDNLCGYRILKDASKVIALTETEVEQYKRMGVSEGRIEIVPNGIDLAEFENLPLRGEFRRKYGINGDQKIVLYLGRIEQSKGIDLLVKAFAVLTENLADTKLVIVGADYGFLPVLRKLTRELSAEEDIVFTGPLYERDRLEAYVDAEVYVLPSFYETFPVTVLEACACGTPVIVTDRCGIADVVAKIGYVVGCDEDQLRDVLLKALNNERLRRRLGNEGKRLVTKAFNWDVIVEKVEKLYERTHNRG